MKKIALFLLMIFSLSIQSCLPIKSVFLAQPDAKDMERFPFRTIQASEDCFSFERATDLGKTLKVNDWTTDIPFFISLEELAQLHETRSFLVIQRDSILFEYYRKGLNEKSNHPSYSIAKSFTSTLVGIAIDEKYIGDVNDLVIQYIPELEGEHFESLTIEHLLNHTSGIEYSLAVDATIYYGNDVLKSLKHINFTFPPGTRQHYVNLNIQLLGLILHRATGIYPAQYLEEKIWQPLGMCHDGIWTVDKKNELEKTFCCMGATALDYAKFGRLFLHGGVWNGERILSKQWYEQSIRRDTTDGSSFNYNYSWHMGLKEYGDFMAIGLYKQHIYIHPKKELIIVLLNDREKPLKAERVNWWYIFRQISDLL